MDPLSTVATIGALVGTCASASKALNDIRSRYTRASLTLTAISTECTLMSTTLSQVGQLIQRDPESFKQKIYTDVGVEAVPLDLALQSAIESSTLVMAMMQETLRKCSAKGSSGLLSWKSKARFLWSEADMKDTLETVRRLQLAIGTLLTAMQAESSRDVKEILDHHAVLLQTMVRRTKTIRQSYAESTIGGVDTSFTFDEEVISSAAYRRAFREFTSDQKLPARPEVNRNSGEFLTADQSLVDWNSNTIVPIMAEEPANDGTATATASGTVSDSVIPRKTNINLIPTPFVGRDPELDQLLHTAVENGNKELVEILLAKGANIETAQGTLGYRPLHLACRQHWPEITKLLLDRGADMSATDDVGNTALHVAGVQDPKSLQLLHEHGADIDIPGENGYTALHFAVKGSKPSMVRELIKLGANVEAEASGDWDCRPLHLAAKFKEVEAAEILLSVGKADVRAPIRNKNLPLHLATICLDLAIVKTIVAGGAPINEPGYNGYRPVHYAAQCSIDTAILTYFLNDLQVPVDSRTTNGNTPLHLATQNMKSPRTVIAYLLQFGAEIEAINDNLERPLHIACSHGNHIAAELLLKGGADIEAAGHREREWPPMLYAGKNGSRAVIEVLLKQGAKIDGADQFGNTALTWACVSNHTDAARLLLDRGANIEVSGAKGYHPLHHAACNNSVATLQMLIEAGADTESVDKDGSRPVHVACMYGRIEILEALLTAGASIESVGLKGTRAIHIAAARKSPDALKLLIDKGAEIDAIAKNGVDDTSPLHRACHYGCVESVKFLIAAGADPSLPCLPNNYPINFAAMQGNVEIIRLLLEVHGCDIHAKGYMGWTPLHHAAGNGKGPAIDHFLSHGADIERPANDGATPLIIAVKVRQYDAARRLLAAGANIEAKQKDGFRALHWAVENGDLQVVTLLKKNGANKSAQINNGSSALALATKKGNTKIIEILL